MEKKNLMNNYRPIAQISNLAKVFEKVLFLRLYSFVTKFKIINKNQFGFLKNKSTEDAIALFSEYIYNNLSKSKPTIVTFLDYSKAFDTVNHERLLDKLYNLGIRGVFLQLIKSYLENRIQIVKVNRVTSMPVTVNIDSIRR